MLNYYEYADILRIQQEEAGKKRESAKGNRADRNCSDHTPVQCRPQTPSHLDGRESDNARPIPEPAERVVPERSASDLSQRCSSLERPSSRCSTRYLKVPVHPDIDPVMLEVCIKILSQSRDGRLQKSTPNMDLARCENVRRQVNDNKGAVHRGKAVCSPPQANHIRNSQPPAPPVRLRLRPKSSPKPEIIQRSLARAKMEQRFDKDTKGIPHADVKSSNMKDTYNYATGPRQLIVHPDCQKQEKPKERKERISTERPPTKPHRNSLYSIPRPKAPLPGDPDREQIVDEDQKNAPNQPDSDLKLNLPTSPKYTHYALEYQDRNNFKQKPKIHAPETKVPEVSNNSFKHSQRDRPKKDIIDIEPTKAGVKYSQNSDLRQQAENVDGENADSFIRQSPVMYETKTALRIKLPVAHKSKERSNHKNVRHSRSLENISTEIYPSHQYIEKHKSQETIEIVEDNYGQNGQLSRYSSDPDAINPDSLHNYIDTFQAEMQVQSRGFRSAPQKKSRPKTAPVPSPAREKELVEAERMRKQKILRDAIKGWGSPTLVFKPKSNINCKGKSPLMIRPVECQSRTIHIAQDNSRSPPSKKVMPVNPSRKIQEFKVDSNDAHPKENEGLNKGTCELKFRVRRMSRPRTSGPSVAAVEFDSSKDRDLGQNRNEGQKTALENSCGSTIPPHHAPLRTKSALSRTSNAHRYDRPQTSVSIRSSSSQGHPRSALEKLVVFGNQMRTENPRDDCPTEDWPYEYGNGFQIEGYN